MQEQLRHLSRQVLRAQEEERKRISRELHDVIAQTLTGINVQLAALKKEAAVNPKRLDQKIARTQKLVEHSVNVVHRFARELRPTVLGAAGFLLKQASSHNLAKAIKQSQDREAHFKKKNNRLSSREVEVLQLIVEGKPNKQVASELGVSFKTVDKHRQHSMGKLNIHDVAGLTRYAIAEGIIQSEVRLTIT